MSSTHYKNKKSAARDYLLWAQGGDNSAQKERLRRNLHVACEQALTPRQRQLMYMHFERQMGVAEIARTLSLDVSTVSRTLSRARRRLRAALQYSL